MADNRIEAIERLQRLRADGALSDAEFETEKARILSETAQPGRSHRKSLAIGAGIMAFLGIATASALLIRPAPPAAPPPNVKATKPSAPASAAAAPQGFSSPLEAAFFAATGHKQAFTEDEGRMKTMPLRLLDLPFGPVLLTGSEDPDGCHACTGFIAIHYLDRVPTGFKVRKSWPEGVSGWGWGALPNEWSVTDKFTTYPAIYAEGGYSGQGYTCGSATITELRPEGPVTSDNITLSYSDGGAVEDESKATELDGKIGNITREKSFDVVVPGPHGFRERYIRKGNKFVRVGETRLSC